MTDPTEKPTAGLTGTTLFALLLAAAQAPLGSTMIAVALPSISQDLSETLPTVTTFLVSTYLVVNVVTQSPGGKLGDLFGHVRTVGLGLSLIAAGCIAALLSSRLPLMVASRAVMAVGGALCVPGAIALLRIHVARDRQGRVFGLVGATMGLAAAVGPPVGGELVSRFGWRGIFFAPLPVLALSGLLLAVSGVPRTSRGPTMTPGEFVRGFDWPGSLLFAAGLVPLVVAPRAAGGARWAALAGSLVLLGAFVVRELRAAHPVLDPRLFRNRGFAAGSAVIGIQNFAMYGLLFQLPQFFEKVRGAPPKSVGHVLFYMMIAMFSMSFVGGRLTDRFGSRNAALLGSGVVLAGMLWMQRLGSFVTPRDAIPALVLLGLGLGLAGAPTQSAAVSTIPLTQAGMAGGASATMRHFGGVLSILVLSIIMGDGASLARHEMAAGVFGAASALAMLVSAALPRARGAAISAR